MSRKVSFYFITYIVIILSIYFILELFFILIDPFKVRLEPSHYLDHIAGKDQSYTIVLENKRISFEKVSPTVLIKRNELGFRGTDLPENSKDLFKIFTMGGSTTECIALSDGITWPDLIFSKFNKKIIWGTNAGVDGQSSFGHNVFLKEHILELKPNLILFLIGANEQNEYYLSGNNVSKMDFGRVTNRNFEKTINRTREENIFYSASTFFFYIVEKLKPYSRTFTNISEMRRRYLADKLGLNHQFIDFSKKDFHTQELLEELKLRTHFFEEGEIDLNLLEQKNVSENRANIELKKQKHYQIKIEKNIQNLIRMSRENNIDPVFITQPALFGEGIDPTTGVNLSSMVLQKGNVGWGQGLTGKEMWTMLENYNDIVRKVAKENNVLIIDLARKMAKDSKYYYDFIHYGKEGAQEVARIVYTELCPYLSSKHKLPVKCSRNQ